MTDPTQTTLTEAQRRVLAHLPKDGSFAVMQFAEDLPLGTSWIDGARLFERHAWDTSKFRLAALGQRLKEIPHAD